MKTIQLLLLSLLGLLVTVNCFLEENPRHRPLVEKFLEVFRNAVSSQNRDKIAELVSPEFNLLGCYGNVINRTMVLDILYSVPRGTPLRITNVNILNWHTPEPHFTAKFEGFGIIPDRFNARVTKFQIAAGEPVSFKECPPRKESQLSRMAMSRRTRNIPPYQENSSEEN